MNSKLSIGCVVRLKKILETFQSNETILSDIYSEYTLCIVNVKMKHDLKCIEVYDGFDYGYSYELLVSKDSKDLKSENLIKINKMLIVLDYDIIKSRKRKRTNEETNESKKAKLDELSDCISFKEIVNLQLENESIKKKYINVFGVIEAVNEIKIIKTQKYEESTELLNFNLMDEIGNHVKCALWGMNAMFYKHSDQFKTGSIILIKNAQLSPFDGVTLSCTFRTKIHFLNKDSYLKCTRLDEYFKNEHLKTEPQNSLSYIYNQQKAKLKN